MKMENKMKRRLNESLATSSLIVSAPSGFPGNVKFGGISLTRSSWVLGSPFKKAISPDFQKLNIFSFQTHLFSSKEEQSNSISNQLEVNGGSVSWSVSASVDFLQEYVSNKERTIVSKQYYQSFGVYSFRPLAFELRTVLKRIFDYKNKTPKEFKLGIENFINTYGYYAVLSYSVFANLSANWELTSLTESKKREVSADIKAKLSKAGKSVSVTDELVASTLSEKKETALSKSIRSRGLNVSVTTPDVADSVLEKPGDYVDPQFASIERMNIVSWSTFPTISDILIGIPKEYNEALSLLEEGFVSQTVWNEISLFVSSVSLFDSDLQGVLTEKQSEGLTKLRDELSDLKVKLFSLPEKGLQAKWNEAKRELTGKLVSFQDRLEVLRR